MFAVPLGAKLLLTPVIAGLVVGAAAILLAGGIFILPVYVGLKIRRRRRMRKERKILMSQRAHGKYDACDYSISNTHL